MLCYKDMSFCSASYKEAEKPCICTECIPFNNTKRIITAVKEI